jgi:hypothetical protein
MASERTDRTKTMNSEESLLGRGEDPTPPRVTKAGTAESERSAPPARRRHTVKFQSNVKGKESKSRRLQSDEAFRRRQIEAELSHFIVLPWTKAYKCEWCFVSKVINWFRMDVS